MQNRFLRVVFVGMALLAIAACSAPIKLQSVAHVNEREANGWEVYTPTGSIRHRDLGIRVAYEPINRPEDARYQVARFLVRAFVIADSDEYEFQPSLVELRLGHSKYVPAARDCLPGTSREKVVNGELQHKFVVRRSNPLCLMLEFETRPPLVSQEFTIVTRGLGADRIVVVPDLHFRQGQVAEQRYGF